MQTSTINAAGSLACQHRHTSLRGDAFQGTRLVARPAFQAAQQRRQSGVIRAAAATETAESLGTDLWNKTYYPTGADAANVIKPWYIIDAEGQTLGRLATLAAMHIRGKHLPTYTPSVDMGGYVIVINAEKVTVSGNKFNDKLYRRVNVGRPGSMKVETFKQLQARIPERIIEKAVYGMLPKGRLGKDIRLHLKVFEGTAHPHEAQAPVDITHKINGKPKAGN